VEERQDKTRHDYWVENFENYVSQGIMGFSEIFRRKLYGLKDGLG